MSKNTSVLLGEYYDKFISRQVQTGKYASASEVMRIALRLLEDQEKQKEMLIHELEIGEKSGFIENFDPTSFTQSMHKKYISSGLQTK